MYDRETKETKRQHLIDAAYPAGWAVVHHYLAESVADFPRIESACSNYCCLSPTPVINPENIQHIKLAICMILAGALGQACLTNGVFQSERVEVENVGLRILKYKFASIVRDNEYDVLVKEARETVKDLFREHIMDLVRFQSIMLNIPKGMTFSDEALRLCWSKMSTDISAPKPV